MITLKTKSIKNNVITLKDYKYHINKELDTIKDFDKHTSDKVKIRKILNDSFSTYDFTFSLDNKIIYLCEVKTRTVSSTRYSDTILEQGKVDRMNKEVQKAIDSQLVDMVIRPAFLVSFTDGMWLFDMTRCKTTSSKLNCPKSTAKTGNGHHNRMVEKALVHFKIEDAIKIK